MASPSPLVSIVIPTHDRPRFLRDALASVAAQTYRPIEAVVVNDAGCPVEHVVQWARRSGLQATYVWLGINRERSAARNTGLQLARGEYVCFLDDDDSLEPRHVEALVTASERAGASVAYSDARGVIEVRSWLGYRRLCEFDWPVREFDRGELLVQNLAPIHCFLVGTQCAREVGGFDVSLRASEDWDLWIRLSRGSDFLHVPEATASYRLRMDGSNTSIQHLERMADWHLRVMEKHGALLESRPDLVARQRAVFEAMLQHGRDGTTPLDYLVWRERTRWRRWLASLPGLSQVAALRRALRRRFTRAGHSAEVADGSAPMPDPAASERPVAET